MRSDSLTPPDLLAARRAMMPSWIVSAVVHAAVLVLVGVLWQVTPEGAAQQSADRTAGIVLKKHTPQGEFFEDAEETFAASAASVASSSRPKTELEAEAPPTVDLTGLIAKPPTLGGGGLSGNGLGLDGDPTQGTGHARLAGGKLRTSIYGLEGEGHKFVYVFDRSESMYGKPLAAAKAQLVASLAHLERIHQFGIIFYNHELSVFNPGRLSFGDEASKVRAERYIRGVTAAGATNHYPALMHALRLSPDVIFLLTDGERHNDPTQDELRRIRHANGGTQINVIQFVQGEESVIGNALVQLAHENGGQHKFVDVQKLK